MRAAANLLALCLLALASLPARCQHGEASTENYHVRPLCYDLPRFVLFSNSHHCRFYDSYIRQEPNKLSVAHGTEVAVRCSIYGNHHAEKITISSNGKEIIPDDPRHPRTWIWSQGEKLDLQSLQYTFKCSVHLQNLNTTCERSVNILVTPRFEVISPNVYKTCFYNECSLAYYVQYGNSVSVRCSGADATRLVMSKDGKTLPTERKNGTTIEFFEMTPDLQISKYACSDIDTTHSTSMNMEVVPNIYFQSQNETITPYNMKVTCLNSDSLQQEYHFQYSGSIEMFCSGPRAVKFMDAFNKNKIVSTENYNETTVFTNITKSGIWEHITCADSEFSDFVQTVNVLVLHRMEVVSPSVRFVGIFVGSRHYIPQYTILYGQPLEIVCCGDGASQLTISDPDKQYKEIDTTNSVVEAVNKSAIKFTINNPSWIEFAMFACHTNLSQSLISYIEVAVLPTVTNFRCVSYNLQLLNCTWTGTGESNTANNTLYYVADGNLIRICPWWTSRLSKLCKWEYENDYRYQKDTDVLTFLLHSCSFIACYNQTFKFNHLSIVKLAPPEGLEVLRTTSRGAVLKWRVPRLHFGYHILTAYSGDVHHKVQYWYYGIESRDVNSSLVTCDYEIYCKIDLNLPCPDKFYEVRISHKLKKASEEFMSAPSSVTFYTDRESNNAINNDPTCSQEPVKTKEVMTYIVQELRKEMRPEIQPMKRAVHALQEKLANVRKYIASIKEQHEKQ